jgi:hypothetical protein
MTFLIRDLPATGVDVNCRLCNLKPLNPNLEDGTIPTPKLRKGTHSAQNFIVLNPVITVT